MLDLTELRTRLQAALDAAVADLELVMPEATVRLGLTVHDDGTGSYLFEAQTPTTASERMGAVAAVKGCIASAVAAVHEHCATVYVRSGNVTIERDLAKDCIMVTGWARAAFEGMADGAGPPQLVQPAEGGD